MDGSFSLTSSLAAIGVVTLVVVVIKTSLVVYSGFRAFVVTRWLRLGVDFQSLGSWAVVTGATDGIGKAYAVQLAQRGLDVVLISRSADKLTTVAKEIEASCSVKTKCIAVDFTGGPEIYDKIAQELGDRDIGVLVNNVGKSRDAPGRFVEVDDDYEMVRDIIAVNCNALTFMTKIVLPKMVEKRKGAIINVSSILGAIPSPTSNAYSGTKAYVDFFSRALQVEYASKGIVIQCVMPGTVQTKMVSQGDPTLFSPDPTTYVRSALDTVGIQRRTFGYLPHAVVMFILLSVPEWLYQRLISSYLLGTKKRLTWEKEQRLKQKKAH